MKFERKPIESKPTCAMCGRSIRDHTQEEMNICIKERKESTKHKHKNRE